MESKPTLSHENLLINELIREYLQYNQYQHSLSVFLKGMLTHSTGGGGVTLSSTYFFRPSETNQPKEPLQKDFLKERLNIAEAQSAAVDDDVDKIPLLYRLLFERSTTATPTTITATTTDPLTDTEDKY